MTSTAANSSAEVMECNNKCPKCCGGSGEHSKPDLCLPLEGTGSLELRGDLLSTVKDLEELFKDFVHTIDLDVAQLKRVCANVCKSHSRLGERTLNKLSQLNTKDEVIRCLSEEVGLEDVQPLVTFQQFLHVESADFVDRKESQFIRTLLKHQESVVPFGVENTSPPGTPFFSLSNGTTIFYDINTGSGQGLLSRAVLAANSILASPSEAQD